MKKATSLFLCANQDLKLGWYAKLINEIYDWWITSFNIYILSHFEISEVLLVLKIQTSLVIGQIAILEQSLFQEKLLIPGSILFSSDWEDCIFIIRYFIIIIY